MKHKFLVLMLALCMVISALPVTALAAEGNTNDFFTHRQPWLYSVIANMKSEQDVDANEEIREREQQTYNFKTIDYGSTSSESLQLTFKNISNTEGYSTSNGNPNNYGKVDIAVVNRSAYFDFAWNTESRGHLESQGDTAVLTITPRSDLPAGKLKETILFMEQNSRIGWTVELAINVHLQTVEVTPTAAVTKPYGTALDPADITVECDEPLINGKTLADLGVKELLGPGANADSDVSDSPYTYKYSDVTAVYGNYEVKVNDTTSITVEKVKPKPDVIYVKEFTRGTVLSNAGESDGGNVPSGEFINPYSGKTVAGTFKWGNNGQVIQGPTFCICPFTFTPIDTKNYEPYKSNIAVKIGDGTYDPESGAMVFTTLTPSATEVQYNGRPQSLTFKTNRTDGQSSSDSVYVLYKPHGEDGEWTETAPTDPGTYDVSATIQPRYGYTGAAASTVYTIKPRTVKINVSVYSKPYTEGNTSAQIVPTDKIVTGANGDKLGLQCGALTGIDCLDARFDTDTVGTGKTVTITFKHGTKIVGNHADKYVLPDQVTVYSEIFPIDVIVHLRELHKYYGQSMDIVGSDFDYLTVTSVDKNYDPDSISVDIADNIQAVLTSAGTSPTAAVNTYGVNATGSCGNYRIYRVDGGLEVLPAVPQRVDVVAPLGKNGDPASTIEGSIQATYRNPYNGEPVTGTVELTAEAKNQIISSEAQSLEYIFKPSSANYTEVHGYVSVSGVETTPAALSISGETSVTYDGNPHAVTGVSDCGAAIKVEYSSNGNTYDTSAPVDAGTYKVKVMADTTGLSGYSDNHMETTLVIAPAVPTGTVSASGVDEGQPLSASRLTANVVGAHGETVPGTVSWDNVGGVSSPENVIVTAGSSYNWTFTPSSANYTSISGNAPVAVTAKAPAKPSTGPSVEPSEPSTQPSEPSTQPSTGGSTGGSAGGGSVGGGGAPAGGGFGGGAGTATRPDGSTTTTDRNGNVTEKVTNVDGSVTEKTVTPEGVTGQVNTDARGKVTSAEVVIPRSDKVGQQDVVTAPVRVPAAKSAAEAPEISLKTQSAGRTRVEIPVTGFGAGTVAVLIREDGTEEVVRDCTIGENGVVLAVEGDVTLKIVDRAESFTDVKPVDHWASSAVEFVAARELFKGTGDNKFAPNGDMTRGMLVTVLHRLAYEPENTGDKFADVDSGAYYADAVAWAQSEGIVTGYTDDAFGPDDNVQREQLVTILYRYAQRKGYDTGTHGTLAGFADASSVSGWASDAMSWATELGLVNGVDATHLAPANNATRAEVATILMRFCEKVVK